MFATRQSILRIVCGCALLTASASSALSEDPKRGDLRMRFVFNGVPPMPKLVGAVPGGPAPKAPLADESLEVNPVNHGVENVVVYLDADRSRDVATAPWLQATKGDKAELTVRNERLEPHVLLMQTGTMLAIRNRDQAGSVANVDFARNGELNETLAARSTYYRVVELSEPRPCLVQCSIKPWLNGYVVVQDTPYMAKSDIDGDLRIRDLPIGVYTFRVWHERVGFLREIAINGKPTDRTGRFQLSIQEDELVVPDVLLPPTLFKR